MAINPLQPPINYMGMAPQLDLAKQFEGFGQALAERQKRMQAEAIKAAYATDLETVLSNPSISEFNKFALKYPQQREVVKDVASRFTTEQQDAEFNIGRDVAVALENGKPEVALGVLNKTIEARKGSNLPTTVYDQIQQILSNTEDPDRVKKAQAQTNFSLTLLNPEKFAKVAESLQKQKLAPEEFGEQQAKTRQAITEAQTKVADLRIKLQNEPIEAERLLIKRDLEAAQAAEADIKAKYAERLQIAGLNKTNWDIKNLQSQISDRAAKLNIDRQQMQATVADKLSSIQARLTDLPEGARKLINESATAAASSKQAATQYNDLANRIQSAEGGKGALTSATEWFAKSLGQQDAWTQIRNEYTRVRNSVAIKALPPGVATDKDIELALKGIPPENANATTLASFLRGTAKLQDIDSAINNAKTDWLSQNNGLLTRSKGTFIAGDYTAKPGETFNDFAQRIVGDVSAKYRSPEQLAEERRQQTINLIPGQATPAVAPRPVPSPASIESQADAILRGGR